MSDGSTEVLSLCRIDRHCSRLSTSAIVTPELLPVISSHFVRSTNPYPILHELPPSFRLHRFTRRPSFSKFTPPPIPCQLSDETQTLSSQPRLRNGVSQALQLAMSTGITGRGRHLPLRAPTPSVMKTTPTLNDGATGYEIKQPVIGNMLLSSCPGKKGALLDYISLRWLRTFPCCSQAHRTRKWPSRGLP